MPDYGWLLPVLLFIALLLSARLAKKSTLTDSTAGKAERIPTPWREMFLTGTADRNAAQVAQVDFAQVDFAQAEADEEDNGRDDRDAWPACGQSTLQSTLPSKRRIKA